MNTAIKYIRTNSDQNAEAVKEKLLNKINSLVDDKTVHRKDPYKKNNDGNYLYFEILKYRVVYYKNTAYKYGAERILTRRHEFDF